MEVWANQMTQRRHEHRAHPLTCSTYWGGTEGPTSFTQRLGKVDPAEKRNDIPTRRIVKQK